MNRFKKRFLILVAEFAWGNSIELQKLFISNITKNGGDDDDDEERYPVSASQTKQLSF